LAPQPRSAPISPTSTGCSSNQTARFDLKPYLTGAKKGMVHKHLFWKRENIAAFRQGSWKLIHVEQQGYGLFDLSKELTETNNLATDYLSQAKAMAAQLERWQSGLAEPNWHEGDNWNKVRVRAHKKQFEPTILNPPSE